MPASQKCVCHCQPNCNRPLARRQRNRHYKHAHWEGRAHSIAPSTAESDSADEFDLADLNPVLPENATSSSPQADESSYDTGQAPEGLVSDYKLTTEGMLYKSDGGPEPSEDKQDDLRRELLWCVMVDMATSEEDNTLPGSQEAWEDVFTAIQDAHVEQTAVFDDICSYLP